MFNWLDDIDDVLYFARCCRLVHSVSEFPGFRLAVFRPIIGIPMPIFLHLANENTFEKYTYSPQHEYDVVPSKNIVFYGAHSQVFYETKHVPEDRRSGRGTHLASRLLSAVDSHTEIPAEIIWDVVCRWQGMRPLFDLYCDSSIETTSCTTPIVRYLGWSRSSNQAVKPPTFLVVFQQIPLVS